MQRIPAARSMTLARCNARALLGACGLAAMAMAVGCSSGEASSRVAVTPSQFVRPAGTPEGPEKAAAVERRAGALRVTSAEHSGPFAESDGIVDVISEPGAPTVDPNANVSASIAKGPAFVDAKVGDINNKAIYASEFLEPMGDRLKDEAAKLKPDAWRKFASEQIEKELNRMLEDELLRAEALSSLKPEQRQGLSAMIDNYAEEQRLRAGGSGEAWRRQLEAQQGKTVEQYLKDRQNTELISYEIYRKINNKVQVSRKDLELAYEKNYDLFNPYPKAHFREILLDSSKPALIEEVRQQLQAGTPFAQVAARPENAYSPSTGGAMTEKELKVDLADAELFTPKEFNDAATQLGEGQWTGPVTFTTSTGAKRTVFIYLEKIDRVQTSFYDAQLMMEGRLREMRSGMERAKYIKTLKTRASYTPVEEMTERLVAIASERYGPGAPTKR